MMAKRVATRPDGEGPIPLDPVMDPYVRAQRANQRKPLATGGPQAGGLRKPGAGEPVAPVAPTAPVPPNAVVRDQNGNAIDTGTIPGYSPDSPYFQPAPAGVAQETGYADNPLLGPGGMGTSTSGGAQKVSGEQLMKMMETMSPDQARAFYIATAGTGQGGNNLQALMLDKLGGNEALGRFIGNGQAGATSRFDMTTGKFSKLVPGAPGQDWTWQDDATAPKLQQMAPRTGPFGRAIPSGWDNMTSPTPPGAAAPPPAAAPSPAFSPAPAGVAGAPLAGSAPYPAAVTGPPPVAPPAPPMGVAAPVDPYVSAPGGGGGAQLPPPTLPTSDMTGLGNGENSGVRMGRTQPVPTPGVDGNVMRPPGLDQTAKQSMARGLAGTMGVRRR